MVHRLASGCFFGSTAASVTTPHIRVVLKRHVRADVTPLHGHERPYLALVARGAFLQRGGASEQLCIPGSLAINTAGAEHDDRFEAELSEVINIEPSPAWLESARADGGRDPGYRWITRTGLHERARLVRRHLERPEPLSVFVIEGVAAELIGLALDAASPVRMDRGARWLRVVEEHLRASFRSPPSLAELARLADRSPSQVVRAFRLRHGRSIGAFVRALRADYARRALLETDASLTEIALQAGYCDQSHMTRELGAFLGCTPARLRRRGKA